MKVDDSYRKSSGWKTRVKEHMETNEILTLTEVFFKQKRVNSYEHTLKIVSHNSFWVRATRGKNRKKGEMERMEGKEKGVLFEVNTRVVSGG